MADMDDDLDEITDVRLQIFHNTVREHTIFLLLLITLYMFSYILTSWFRRKDREDICSNDKDELLVYRISIWLSTFAMAVALGAALLLPVSIISNEVLLLYPKSYYVKWLNSSLIQGLWNHVFLFSNLSLFVLLPFAYLFSESIGFSGYKKGLVSRIYETFTVFSLFATVLLGFTYMLSAFIKSENTGLLFLLSLGSVHLPFLYSCVSFLGVLMLMVSTPVGFIRLFGIVSQVLTKKPTINYVQLLRNGTEGSEILEHHENNIVNNDKKNTGNDLDTESIGEKQILCDEVSASYPIYCIRKKIKFEQKPFLQRLEQKRFEFELLHKSWPWKQNFLYPLAMLMLLLFTGITILLVVQNTLELLIGFKALPLSTRQFTLGLTSLSKLGLFGASLEIILILYLGANSIVGFYSMPFMHHVRPKLRHTSLPQLILNCAILLTLSSALPLLSRIIGITNFDLLGDFGAIEWLGNFRIVLLYNLIFGTSVAVIVVKKFSATVRRELCARLMENYMLFTNYISFIN